MRENPAMRARGRRSCIPPCGDRVAAVGAHGPGLRRRLGGRGARCATAVLAVVAAAVAALADRHRTVARLRGLGAVVVDAPPGRLAPELADAYLRVKATGRL